MECNKQYLIDDDMENDRVDQLLKVQEEAKELFERKNADYGDAFAEYGTIGILVRLGDKIKRLQSISNRGITLVNDEKLRDTLIDLHNYAAMGIMLLDEGDYANKSDNEGESVDIGEDELILEDNEPCKRGLSKDTLSVDRWEIYGDSGNQYKRQRYTNKMTGKITEACSCPSYIYSDPDNQTCKHIKFGNKYKLVSCCAT